MHDARHAHASLMLKQGVHPKIVQERLGHSSIQVTIDTYGQGQATAIANIKNILNQNKGVFYGFSLPDAAAWGDFFDFWDGVGGETEASFWNPDTYCGTEWNENPGQAGGHAVLILGYVVDVLCKLEACVKQTAPLLHPLRDNAGP